MKVKLFSKYALFLCAAVLMLNTAIVQAQCVSIHQVPYKFTATNSQAFAGIQWHSDLTLPHQQTWIFRTEHDIHSHKIQFEFFEHVMTNIAGAWGSKSASETCQVRECTPTLAVKVKYPDGSVFVLNSVRQPGLEIVPKGIIPLNGSPLSALYFLDEDKTSVTALVPRDTSYGQMIPAGSIIMVRLSVPALQGGQCEKMCGELYILGAKQRSCQMSYINCKPPQPAE